MIAAQIPSKLAFSILAFIMLMTSVSYSQTMQLEVVGGAVVTQGSTITISAGTSLDFRITNVSTTSCKNLRIQDVDIDNTTDFDITPNNPKRNIKPYSCNGGKKFLDFEIENISPSCTIASTLVTVEIKDQPDFTFTLQVTSSPEIYVLGGNPWQDINHGDTTTSDTNGTYFGIVDEGNTVTRNYIVANIGSCDLDITAVSSSNGDFVAYSPYGWLPPTITLSPYYYTIISVTFTAPVAGIGTQSSVISISNSDNTTFTFTVSAEMFNENIPGPGGITSNFKLWLKSTRGIVTSGSSLTDWLDLGTNGKDATTVAGKEPTYLDTVTDNINFNPVVKFENDGVGTEQYMYNNDTPISGFYNHDIFIVMIPDATMTNASNRNTIFAGIDSGDAGDITGVGFGDYSSEFNDETLSYNQDVDGGGSYNGEAELNATYSNAGIINVRNNAASSPTKQEILYNSNVLTTSNVSEVSFTNIVGSEYWIGKNFDVAGSLNGRVAEIFTFAERLSDADRQKVESYLGIKYGITLGASTEATKDYINSFDTKVWDATANAGYNYHVAGIGRDSISDLNQKQSKSINYANAVTIGLGGVFDTNNANPNEFVADGDFLVWGNNNAAFSGTNTNTVTVATGVTTTLTRVDRKWKIVESIETGSGGDIETVYISIPLAAFSSFTKTTDEEYALIVADNENFTNGDIIDVIPLRSDGGSNLETWYDFDGTKYFSFGKTSKLSQNHSINIASGDYMVGDYLLNLNTDNFTISAWLKVPSNASDRTIMAKGDKLQIRLNTTGNIEVYIDDAVTPKFTSNMDIDDGKWHHTTYVYDSGSLLIYVDGVLDKSVQNVVHPSPNYNHYAVGALYLDKSTVTNPLLGEIDEVYVWDIALSETQVRYLMNQEIERFDIAGTDYVEGKVLPQAASNNPTDTIPWSSLRVYYDFNSFYGSTIEGLTDDRYFLRLNYLNKTKTILEDQTTPLPYVSAADGAWDTGATWSNNADQVIPNSLSLDGSTIIDWNIVEIAHDITSGDRDITLLGLKQTEGTLTIADPFDAQNETNSGQALTVTNYLEIDGVIDLVGESQLVQTDGSIIDADSGGYIERDQQGTANAFNYNYWSSSVGPITGNIATRGTGTESTNANHTISGVLNDGTTSSAYTALTFNTAHTAADSNTPTTPRTLSTYWMYKFYGPQDDYYAWTSIDETSSLLPGEGFTMKGTSGAADIISDFQNYVFKGLPNNGDITLPLDKSSGDVERLIGNPYPSAIDAREFILDHLSEADGGNNTVNVINGAVYFWDHFGEENSHYLRDYVGGYATYNLTGGAPAISNDARINNTSDAGNPAVGTKVPGQYIPVNQGFFVSTALDSHPDNNTPSANISTISGGNIVFKNTQRVFVTEQDASSSFLRTSVKKKSKSGNTSRVVQDLPSVRIIYDSPKGYHRQLLLGVDSNASKGFDLGYDAFMVDVNVEDMYWNIDERRFVIQGVDTLSDNQEFPLGLIVDENGVINIRLEELNNIDSSTSIYVRDNKTSESFKINNNIFSIKLDAGVYNDRFSIVFKQQSKSVESEDSQINHGLLAYYDSNTSKIKIVNTNKLDLNNLRIYNLAGQEISVFNIDASTNEVSINVSHGVYLLKFNTSLHGIINKKIIVK